MKYDEVLECLQRIDRRTLKGIKSNSGKYTFATVQEVREQYDSGLSLKVISRNTGVPVNTMADWIYRNQRRYE